jgi:protein-tyrosine phosphatase
MDDTRSDTRSSAERIRVLFVCLGNICRSPLAEGVFLHLAERAGVADRFEVDSAGTGDWHVGERADHRTLAALERRGYDGGLHRARQFTTDSFDTNDLVIALDRSHERILRGWARRDDDADKVALLLGFEPQSTALDVPDPYYAGPAKFDEVLGMIESATRSLFHQLEPAIRPGSRPTSLPYGAGS